MMGVCAHTLEAPTMAVWPATAMKPSTCTPSSLEERYGTSNAVIDEIHVSTNVSVFYPGLPHMLH